MGVRRATILLTGVTLADLLTALYAASRVIILDRFLFVAETMRVRMVRLAVDPTR